MTGLMTIELAISVLATFLAVYIGVLSLSGREESLENKLRRYTAWRAPAGNVSGKTGVKGLLTKIARFTPARWGESLDRELMRGGIPLKGGEFLVIQLFLTFLLFVAAFLGSRNLGVAFLSMALGAVLPRLYVQHSRKKRYAKFDNQLADALLIIANSLKAGFSFLQAMEMVGQEMPEPISGELRLTLREMTYGTATETALEHLSERVGSADLDLLVTAILIQRQVGGNLSEVLGNIHATIQDRLRIQKEIRTLTAQGRTSGYLIAGLPFGIAAILFVINPAYLSIMFTRPLGWGLIAGGLLSQLVGFLFIRKIIAIRV
ncbi:MAG: type II secretion system F family protein [Desulfitobacteriaceae bacterium]